MAPALVSAVALLMAFAPSAFASNCTLDTISPQLGADPALFDAEGYEFDTTAPPVAPQRNNTFATLFEGGSNAPGGTPPGPRSADDSWDSWGALFIGGDAALGNLYFSSDNNSCALEDGGRELAFPLITVNGLQVQRKLFVSSSGLPGARLVEFVRNPGAAAVTTSVQVGDTQSPSDQGDLGSDSNTAVRLDSDANLAIDTNDLWVVTTDNATTDTDLALAHVFDGAGGADRIDFAGFTGTDLTPQDNLAYRWDGVSIAPGQTAAFLSYEIQQGVAGAATSTEVANAASKAQGYQALPFAQIYSGMSDAEIVSVRNWPKPPPTVSIGAVTNAADNAPVTFSSAVVASAVAGMCGTVTSLSWDFGDGAKATGATPSHQFKAGTFNVKLTATNSCGGSATASRSVVVNDRAPKVKASLQKVIKLKAFLKKGLLAQLTSSENSNATITGRISSKLARKVSTARISPTVIRKGAKLKANTKRKLRLKARNRKARKGIKKLVRRAGRKGLKVKMTIVVRDSGKNRTTVRRTVKIKR